MSMIEDAVSWAESIAADDRHGYNQGARDGTDFDCSSLVCRALRYAGFAAPHPSFSTRSMGEWLLRNGFAWHAGLDGIERGCIVWMVGHTAFAVGDGRIVEACIDENGNIVGGQAGDQTGNEIRVTNLNRYQWLGYYRYMEDDMTDADIERIAELAAEKVVNYELNGTLLRDRIIGCDNAANGANNKLADTTDPTGRTNGVTALEHIRWIAKAVSELNDKVDEFMKGK